MSSILTYGTIFNKKTNGFPFASFSDSEHSRNKRNKEEEVHVQWCAKCVHKTWTADFGVSKPDWILLGAVVSLRKAKADFHFMQR